MPRTVIHQALTLAARRRAAEPLTALLPLAIPQPPLINSRIAKRSRHPCNTLAQGAQGLCPGGVPWACIPEARGLNY